MSRVRAALRWLGVNLVPLLICAWAVYAFFALRSHQALPAHEVQDTRSLELSERVAKLEAMLTALTNGRRGYGDRWALKGSMVPWADQLARDNPELAVPDPWDFTPEKKR